MINIDTTLNKQIEANIDGHVYKVRKLGTAEQLKLAKLQKSVSGLDVNNIGDAEIDSFQAIIDIFKHCFDDMAGGKKTKELFEKIPLEDLEPLIEKIFSEAKPSQ